LHHTERFRTFVASDAHWHRLAVAQNCFDTAQQQVLHFHISKIVAGEINPFKGKPHAKPLYEIFNEPRMAISPPQYS